MFKEFFNSLLITDKNDLGKNHETGMLSLTAIFIRIAKLDGVFDKEELQEIRNFLNKRYNLLEKDIDDIISEAINLENDLNDNVQLTKKIKETIAFEDRFSLLQYDLKLIIKCVSTFSFACFLIFQIYNKIIDNIYLEIGFLLLISLSTFYILYKYILDPLDKNYIKKIIKI